MNDHDSQFTASTAQSRRIWRRLVWVSVVIVVLLVGGVGTVGVRYWQEKQLREEIKRGGGYFSLEGESPKWWSENFPDSWSILYTSITGVSVGESHRRGILEKLNKRPVVRLRFHDGEVTAQEAIYIDSMPLETVSFIDCTFIAPEIFDSLSGRSTLRRLSFENCQVNVSALARLKSVGNLEKISIVESNVNVDAALVGGNYPVLKKMNLQETEFSDQSMKWMKSLKTNLQNLDLSSTNITDESLANLKEFHDLEYLDFGDSSISDEGLSHLKNLKSLQVLDLSATLVRGEAFSEFTRLPNLSQLVLKKTSLNITSISDLKMCRSLEWIVVDESNVSDASLELFYPLTNLRYLSVKKTQVSHDGVQRLIDANPVEEIVTDEGVWQDGIFKPW